jgi:Zn-dependent M16 (insulinase) family peptidase
MLLLAGGTLSSQQPELSFGNLAEGQSLSGFKTVAVYLDDSDRAMGARFRHERSGFTLDLLQIQSVPQAFIWVTTYPTSNMGEPHTQEHLLLGKGNKGRALGSQEPMSLVSSSAFTEQWMTCYHFYASAGPEVFYDHFEHTMDALLHPDYSQEEVHREVRNFGVNADPKTGALSLEEKGTVYNEMVTSMDQAPNRLFRAAGLAAYGPEHPLSYNSGGMPESLRVIKPSDIERFHAQHYFLGNMGAIASLPREMTLTAALGRLNGSLNRLEPEPKRDLPVVTEKQLPAPQPAPAGRIEYVEYPFRNEQQPGMAMLLWPAERKLGLREHTLLELFLDNVAGGPDTNLYKRLIDSRTRESDFGAKGVSAYADSGQGAPVYVMFSDMPVARMNDADLTALRAKVLDEFARIAAYKDGSPELAQFNQRLKGRILQSRRDLSKFVNSPPGFGFRGIGAEWIMHLYQLNKEPGFRKSVTEKEDLAAIEKLVGGDRNIWRDYLTQWKLTGVTPYVEAAKPSAALIQQEERERDQRAAAEVERLKDEYHAPSGVEAIRRYRDEYDAATAEIDRAGQGITPPKFVDNPPRTLDDLLDFKSTKLANGVPLVTSTFDSMTSATTGISLRLDVVPEDKLVYLSMLPQLLTRSGVIEDGKPVPYEQMTERLRNEILSLNANFSINQTTNRYELVVRGSGNNDTESKRAIEWMKLALFHPDWRPENLPRLRDLVDQVLGALRNTTQQAEEQWVNDPALAYLRQDSPLLLATSSFMTREHNIFRLRWMLRDGGSQAVYSFLNGLGKVAGSRAQRIGILASIHSGNYPGMQNLSEGERTLVKDAASDLGATLADIPDSSLPSDWTHLCNEMARDLKTGPRRTLETLDEVRRSILTTGGSRMFLIASAGTQKALAGGMEGLAGSLQSASLQKAVYKTTRHIDERLRGRDASAVHPVFVGLLNANSQGGVFLNSAPGASYRDTGRDKLLDLLASNLYAGHGAHGVFMKTWAAGLAYSNGIRPRLLDGRLNYYAERTPELPQTLKFVITELKKAKPDASLTDYAIAEAFEGSRAASTYEDRGESMADDLADGLTPEIVARFHQAILELRKDPKLSDELFRRMTLVDAQVLPGMGAKAKTVAGGVYFTIGPEKQFAAYEQYLKQAEGADAKLFRLYSRDFWQ